MSRKDKLALYIEAIKKQPTFIKSKFIHGVFGYEGKKCVDLKHFNKETSLPDYLTKQDVVCGKIIFKESKKKLYFGRCHIKKYYENDVTDEISLIVPLSKTNNLFITPSKLSSIEMYVWTNNGPVSDIDLDSLCI